ncbi:MAG: cytochrome c [Bacteroidota bacterium]
MKGQFFWWLFSCFLFISCHEKRVTFNEDVAPIIFQNCSSCHRADGIAPFTFSNFADVSEHAQLIKKVTKSGYMPPWNADPSYSNFLQEKFLTKEEKRLISKWVEQGALEGEGPAMNMSNHISKENKPEPDLVVCMEKAYHISDDGVDDYRTFVVPLKLDKPRFVNAVEFVPGNPKAVHHAWVFIDTTGALFEFSEPDGKYGLDSFKGMKSKIIGMLYGYMPGYTSAMNFPEGTGKLLFENTYLIFNLHYSSSSKKQEDQSCIHLYFSDQDHLRQVEAMAIKEESLVNPPLFIPAYEQKDFKIEKKLDKDISVISIYPHMHFRGKSFWAYATTHDQTTIPLIRINNWDFNWQSAHTFKKLVVIPEGSIIHVEAKFDNTASNPFNPIIPPKDAERGNSSYDEMLGLGIEYLNYLPRDEFMLIDEKKPMHPDS